jgi:hypothetical protein
MVLEVAGSGPCKGAAAPSTETDVRHLLAVLFDLSGAVTCQNLILTRRWKETLGMLHEKYYPRYAVAFSKILFALYRNESFSHQVESHLSVRQLREIREKGGPHQAYADEAVPSHFGRYLSADAPDANIGFDIVKDLVPTGQDPRIKNYANRLEANKHLVGRAAMDFIEKQ